jgi:type II secretory pathway component PulC
MDKGTSDERLLKLIEGGSSVQKRKQNIGVSPKKSFSELMQTAKFNISLKSIKEFKPNLVVLNKGLIALAALVTVILIYSLFSGPSVSASNAAYFNPGDASLITKALFSKDSLGGLARKIIPSQEIKKNIFLAPGVKTTSLTEAISANVTEVTKDLKLVGIIWSSEPEVMIENGKDSRTYTLKKGDSFDGDQFKVKEVSRNSALLEVSVGGKVSEYVLR